MTVSVNIADIFLFGGTMSSLRRMGIIEASKGLRKKDFSACELLDSYLSAISKDDTNSYVLVCEEEAKVAALKVDKLLALGENLPMLAGIPIGVKDLFCMKGIATTACSKMLHNFIPTYESGVTGRLLADYAVVSGKLNMDEFAMGVANKFSFFGNVTNPWYSDKTPDVKRIPGGSSGGSAAAVSAYLCAGSIGSDTGGSVRHPASYCGIVGVKPTYGFCSRWGMISFATSLDQAGVFARSVADAAVLLQSIVGYDHLDSTSLNVPKEDFTSKLNKGVKGMKIAIIKEGDGISYTKVAKQALECGIKGFEEGGASITEIEIPLLKYALPVYYIISSAEVSSNLARYDGLRYGYCNKEASSLEELYYKNRTEGFGSEVKRRIVMGAYVLSAGHNSGFYMKACKIRNFFSAFFANLFKSYDFVLLPTTPSVALPMDVEQDMLQRCLSDVYTVPANLAGLPVVSVPVCIDSDSGMPASVQILGKRCADADVIGAASYIASTVGNISNPRVID